MKRVVFDTNVIVSALVFDGKPRAALQAVIRDEIELLISHEILDETIEVLQRPKFRLNSALIQQIGIELLQITSLVTTHSRIDLIQEDPDDNRVLECALDGGASTIVSGDSDLLKLKKYKSIDIINVDAFLRTIGK